MQNETDKPLERVFLIDAMAHIFRAFFAPMGGRTETLKNSKGQETQAVFVFVNLLRKLLHDQKPHYVAAVFDTADKTFRHDNFAAYKANRAEMPEELAAQLPFISRVCEAFNIPILKFPGFEADDLIGTLAHKIADKGLQAVIVSNDKDLCQLVRDPYIVCMRNNSQNIKRKVPVPPVEFCDEAWVEKKFGVPPRQVIDLLGLMGDSVDNIPGAPGIGEKGALNLILQFGSIEEALKHADEVKHKTYRESLQNNVDIIRQSLELATIHTSVPIELDLDALRWQEPNRELAYKLFKELEFASLTREFAPVAGAEQPRFEAAEAALEYKRNYSIINRRVDLDKLIRKLFETEKWSFAANFTSDFENPETDSTPQTGQGSLFDEMPADSKSNKPQLAGISICTARGEVFYVDFVHFAEGKNSAIQPVCDMLSNGLSDKSVYDLKQNLHALSSLNVELEAVTDDVLIAAYLIDPTRSAYEINKLVLENCGVEPQYETPKDWNEKAFRACEMADFTFQIAPILRKKINEFGLEKLYSDVEIPIAACLYRIERAGMKIDVGVLQGLSAKFTEELAKLSTQIFALSGREFKINSPKQVGEILQELNIETGRKTATGQISTSKDVLLELAEKYELPRLIMEFRELEKLKSTYTDTLPEKISADGRIHGKLNQTVAATGRLSSTDPNLQNIPIRTELGQQIRAAFIPEEGCKLLSADYSQLELRILAHITHDPVLIEAYRNNEDIHAKTARLVFNADDSNLAEKRRLAKIVNFGIAYAVEAFGLSSRVGLTVSEAKKVINDYYETYKGVKTYMDETPEKAREKGFAESIYGRRRPMPSLNDRNFNIRARAERESINMPIQGSASDIVKIAMLRVDEALKREKLKAKVIMQVHDELLLEVPDDEIHQVSELLRREMSNAVKLDVPLIADIGVGVNWKNAK